LQLRAANGTEQPGQKLDATSGATCFTSFWQDGGVITPFEIGVSKAQKL